MRFKILECGCHKVGADGFLYSCLVQFSKSGTRGFQTKRAKKWKKLSGSLTKSGYMQAAVHGRIYRVNRLVAISFLKNHDNHPECQHINGVRTDNRVENLKWGTPKHNAADRDLHLATIRGEKHACSKLNDKAVVLIREEIGKLSLSKIAEKFGVSKKLILLIKQNKIWRHVK